MNSIKRWLQRKWGLIDERGIPISKDYSVFIPVAPQHHVNDEGIRTMEAFEIDGMKYFQFVDPFNTTTGRYFAVLAAYEELNMRCDKEYLELHCRAVENIINQQKISITYLSRIHHNLQERLELMPTSEFIFKLCSVLFWDETELAHIHDYDYAKIKIERWKKNPEVLNFFLSKPIKELLPSLSMPEENLPIFLSVAEKISQTHLKHLSEALSAD